MKQMRMRTFIGCVSLAAVAAATASCGDVVRTGRSPVMLTVNSLAAGGAAVPGSFLSDVIRTVPASCTPAAAPCVLADLGTASLGVVPKDVTVAPTSNNQVTITRYHVSFRRADGRNTPGTEVPFAFDGAVTATIQAGGTGTVSFVLVQSTAKRETPLVQIVSNAASVLATIADVTFYGQDLVGNEISVTGSILVDFGEFPG